MSDLDFKFSVEDDEFTFINGGVTPTAVLPQDVKSALLECFRNVAWVNANGPDCYARLEAALNAVKITYISAVYTQSGTVYDTDSLDSLKSDLVVTAYYDDGTTADVTSACTLSGTLAEGTSTITVTYQEKTASFTVTVTEGVPAEYTKYDYIQTKANSGQNSTPFAGCIHTASFAELSSLSCEFDFEPVSGHYTGACILGRRTAAGSTTSYAFYAGDQVLGYHIHGNDSTPTLPAVNNTKHHVKLTNSASSPSKIQIDDGTETDIVWSNTNVVANVGLTLLTNPSASSGNFNLSYLLRIGEIKLYDLSGTMVGDYVPCLRIADNVIGLYDLVEKEFHTATTVSYATIGNSNQRYIVGNWS